jgi:serine/threonine protein kinase
MHEHGIAHLDISLGNVLTDFEGQYKYIDFETSRRYERSSCPPRISGCRGTEIPPDIECGGESCPFKVDVWALGVLILRACEVCLTHSPFWQFVALKNKTSVPHLCIPSFQRTGFDVPELLELTVSMLQRSHEARPTAKVVLYTFDRMEARIESRLRLSRQ